MQRIKAELNALQKIGQLRKVPNISVKMGSKVLIDGYEYINFASNDYLGISTKENLIEEFLETKSHHFSSASARLLSGSSIEFSNLEKTVANLNVLCYN